MRWTALLLLAVASGANAQSKVTLSPVAGRVHLITGATDNIGVSAGPDGILLVDGGNLGSAAEVKEIIASLQRGEAKTLINTHWHHAFANPAFGDAKIIAHKNVASRMLKPNLMFNRVIAPPPPEGRPDETFETNRRLKFNGETIDIVAFPRAHSDSDAIVIFRGSRTVFTGDLFVPHLPWIDYGSGGSVDGLLVAVDRLVDIVPKDAVIVPGHGEISRYSDLLAFREALHRLVGLLRSKMTAGLSLAEIQKQGLPDTFKRWIKADGIPLNFVLESFYKGLNFDDRGENCEFVNGQWFDGERFNAQAGFWTTRGMLTLTKPATVECLVDLKNNYVIPPFAEAHTHKLGTEASVRRDGAALLQQGVFYAMVQDPSHTVSDSLAVLASQPGGLEAIYTQGVITSSWGVMPDFYRLMAQRGLIGAGVTYADAADNLFFTIDNMAELDRKWPRIAAKNRSFVKVILAFSDEFGLRKGNPAYDAKPPEFSKKPGLDPALLPALVAKAQASGLKVSAHIETAADFRVAASAGVDFIAHLPGSWQIGRKTGFNTDGLEQWLITPADAAVAKRRGAKVITTTLRKATDVDAEKFRIIHRHNLGVLTQAGVPILVGSDAFQETVIDELLSLESLQVLTRPKLLDVATRQTAQAMFPGRKLGELKEGYEASFLAYDKNPFLGTTDLRRPGIRVKQGRVLK